MHEKFFLITRADLSAGYQATQAAHAGLRFARLRPDLLESWFDSSNCLVVLAVKDEEALTALGLFLAEEGHNLAFFKEPDIDDELTAIACVLTQPTKLLTNLPLALRSQDARSQRERALKQRAQEAAV